MRKRTRGHHTHYDTRHMAPTLGDLEGHAPVIDILRLIILRALENASVLLATAILIAPKQCDRRLKDTSRVHPQV